MPERVDPWNTTGRSRSSMMTFAGAPWVRPKPLEFISGPNVPSRPEYLRVYKRFQGLPDIPQSPAKRSGGGFTNNYVQSELNPGVAMDNSTQKWRLLMFENGIPIAKGSFASDEDAMQGYSGYIDMRTMGPHGVQGGIHCVLHIRNVVYGTEMGDAAFKVSPSAPRTTALQIPVLTPVAAGCALAPLKDWREGKSGMPQNRRGTRLLPHKGYFVNEANNHLGTVWRPDAASTDLHAITKVRVPKTAHVPTVMEMRMMSSRNLAGGL